MADSSALIGHLFRRHAGMMTSVLTRVFGSSRLDLVEDVVQEALVRALEVWPYQGVPDNPAAWLIQVAKNRALDAVRRESRFADSVESLLASLDAAAAPSPEEFHAPGPCSDDILALLFMCCHPDLPREGQTALALKFVAGLGAAEIARGFMLPETAIAQRIVRAKRLIKRSGIGMAMPSAAELPARRNAVHQVLYLWFNEGHLAHAGPELVRSGLCHEALRLARLVALHPLTTSPESHALAALMALSAARLPARMNDEGDLMLLRDQDRGKWDRRLLDLGFSHLAHAADGTDLTAFHLEAEIAACHAAAPAYLTTDWQAIVRLYERLGEIRPSPLVTLNRAVAQSRLFGPEVALATLLPLAEDARMARYALLPAVLADLFAEAGDSHSAELWYIRALDKPGSAPLRRFLEDRRATCARRIGP